MVLALLAVSDLPVERLPLVDLAGGRFDAAGLGVPLFGAGLDLEEDVRAGDEWLLRAVDFVALADVFLALVFALAGIRLCSH